MAPSLPLVLDHTQLPLAELTAARLDGDLRDLGGAYCSVDVHPSAALRGSALAPLVPDGLVVERMSAAWVLGATPRFPRPVQLCIRSSHRIRDVPSIDRQVRQVVLGDHEIVAAGPVWVTDPFRTAVDLVRCDPVFDRSVLLCVVTLLLSAGASTARCRTELRRVPHLPHKQRALRRLDEVDEVLRTPPR
ncbi:hypothetical protein [Herbiconiux ginsengi]|uniref:AbiEi antitoxin C-terminal domain-containing protein n=1 Tax=Herbiconiux ginsengi TaxID=381665 RepID=A0A1H3PRG6_9MICO|nr:hypothetical protein [Herbiconiux ginsengi]SDZ03636.1 hypothetical protein SAMN05216554_2053 [Herbiconiux ginsengi]